MAHARQRSVQPRQAPEQDVDHQPAAGLDPMGGNAERAENLKRGELPNRARLERSFGVDLGDVRVLLGVGEPLRQAGMDAAAVEDHTLMFADEHPTDDQVAHEVSHIAQARSRPSSAGGTSTPGDSAEQDADAAAARAVAGEPAQVGEAPTGAVQGDWLTGAVIGGILGGPVGAIVGGVIGAALDEDTPEEKLAEFQAGTYGPLIDHQPSSGGMFDVLFDAAGLQLTIRMKVGFDFQPGDPTQVAAGYRPEEFQWTPEEQQEWKDGYLTQVSALWSAAHEFRSTEEGWDDVRVGCTVTVIEDSADPHFVLHVAKYPSDADMVQSSVCGPGTTHGPGNSCVANPAEADGTVPNNGNVALDSNDMRPEAKMDWGNPVTAIPFSKGSTALDAAGRTALTPVEDTLTGDATYRVTLTGRASSDHKDGMDAAEGAIHNMDLARARTASVQSELAGAGVAGDRIMVRNEGENGATDDEQWCRVDAQLGNHQTQNPALHETGHMFGLGDEYPTASNPAGSAVRPTYDAVTRAQTGDVVQRARTEDVMSVGSTVRRWHYSTFLEAFKKITGKQTWSI